MRIDTITVLGGSGFVGLHLANHLSGPHCRLRVLTRSRERHRALWLMPYVELIEADVHDQDQLERHFAGAQAVVNLVGILNARDPGTFHRVHADLPRKVVDACRRQGVRRLLHMSALNAAPDAPSEYLRSKAEGEAVVQQAAGPTFWVTTFRPSVMFGPADDFFNRFAALLRLAPGVLPLACPDAKLAPVYVDDVVRAFANALHDPDTFGQRYDLCGPRSYTLRELVEYTAHLLQVRRLVWGLPDGLARLLARVMERLPGQPFSMDNYRSLTVDAVCPDGGALPRLGVTPTPLEAVVPQYVHPLSHGGRYGALRALARRPVA